MVVHAAINAEFSASWVAHRPVSPDRAGVLPRPPGSRPAGPPHPSIPVRKDPAMLSVLPVRRIAGAVNLPPAECPAAELPDYDPTLADLAAVELAAELGLEDEIEAYFAEVNTVCAVEQRNRELLRLRDELGLPDDDPSIEQRRLESFSVGRCAA